MAFDISSMAAVDTIDIEIMDPRTGEPMIGDDGKPCSVTAYSPGSKEFAAARSAQSNRNLKRLRQRGGRMETSPEEDQAAAASFLTAITRSFNNFTYKGGENGPEMFRACYLDTSMGWLTDQVNTGGGDWGNALKAAPSS